MRIGVDLGGTKIEAVALGPGGRVAARTRRPTPRDDYAATLSAIAESVAEVERAGGARGTIGIGIPGAISPASGRIKNANSVWLNGQPLREDLERLLSRPVRLANDANCFALSEATDGAAAGAAVVFGVIVGTGTGGGVVVNGAVVTGRHAIAGEWGHNPLPWPEAEELDVPPCYCGLVGCIETFLSGPGLARDYHAHGGDPIPAEDIVRRAAQGDAQAEEALARYERRMARALATVINVLDPDVIVLGGGMSNVARLYEGVPRHLSALVFSDRVDTPIVPPRFGDASGVRGAAWLWPEGGDQNQAG